MRLLVLKCLAWIGVISIIFLEVFLGLGLRFPAYYKRNFPSVYKLIKVYYDDYRHVIQYEENCTQHDPRLTYTLKPGNCLFSNQEFKTPYLINSKGFRDDELSLHKPEIIVVGDSQAMGWGVYQNETFAQIIELKTGSRVLNASISSYGTVREIKLLDDIDTSKLRYLVIQYSKNDFEENKSYYKNHNELLVMPKMRYEEKKHHYFKALPYFPGKIVITSLKNSIQQLKKKTAKGRQNDFVQEENEIEFFLNAVQFGTTKKLDHVQLIVFRINEPHEFDWEFIPSLKQELLSRDYPEFIKRMILIDMRKILRIDRDYYVLDDHVNANGHRMIAKAIMDVLIQRKVS